MSPRPSLASPALSPAVTQDSLYTCLFLPYLHFDSYKRLIRRREVILRRLGHGRSRPVPELVAKSDSLELQVVWEYLGHDPPINCRRTLDQYGYPSLRDTRSRDDDQMLYKLTKERPCGPDQDGRTGVYAQWSTTGSGGSSEKDAGQSSAASGWRERLTGRGQADNDAEEDSLLNGNVLMVDQLWLWVIHSRESPNPITRDPAYFSQTRSCPFFPSVRATRSRAPSISRRTSGTASSTKSMWT